MKILISFLIFLVLSSVSTLAIADDENVLISKMQMALDMNRADLVEDFFENNENTLSANALANERLALSYERLSKYKEALKIYTKLIDSKFKIASKLSYYYYKLAFVNAQLFKSINKYMPIDDRQKYYDDTIKYIKLCRENKIDENDILIIEDQLKEIIKFETAMTYSSKYYGLVELVSWQDGLKLVNNTTGIKTNLLSTELGTSLGIGKKLENIKHEFNIEGVVSVAKGTTSSENTSVTYQQSSVNVHAITFGPGYYYKAFSEKVFLGLFIPISYRTGNWSTPSGNYSLEDKKLWGAGYFIQLKFYVGKIAFQTRMGKIFPNPGSHWSMGGIYDF